MSNDERLNIMHVLRAPVGGLFRHVGDLVRGQSARGHQVGLIASTGGGPRAEEGLAQLSEHLALGLTRIAMPRHLGLGDATAVRQVAQRIAATAPNVVHGHGAKGAAYARLAAVPAHAIRAYTPHGGSLHYGHSPIGLLYLTLERVLMPRTDLFLFESAYGRDTYKAKVGDPKALVRVVHNGIAPEEFAPITPEPDATDIVFVGELRALKGIDLLIDAITLLRQSGRRISATVVGDGPDRATLHARAEGLGQSVRFRDPMPAREAFALGRLLIVPSRAESLPYIILEGAGAGLPIVATQVGGIPEIFGPQAARLVPASDVQALARAITTALFDWVATTAAAQALRERVRATFTLDAMVNGDLDAYRRALAARARQA
jgi:glycosyltransferase involved in cell wall biosynthesis